MLEYLTKLQINRNLRIFYSDEYVKQKNEDFCNLPIKSYLEKYYNTMDIYSNEVWEKIMQNLIYPSYDEYRWLEMIYVFGYKSIDNHNFKGQYEVYEMLKEDKRLDEDLRKFIGFMAGNHFFEKNLCNCTEWFSSYYWTRPDLIEKYPQYRLNHTINDVLELNYGKNYLKSVFPTLNWWKREL